MALIKLGEVFLTRPVAGFPGRFLGLKSGHKGLIFVSQLDLARVLPETKACNMVLVLLD